MKMIIIKSNLKSYSIYIYLLICIYITLIHEKYKIMLNHDLIKQNKIIYIYKCNLILKCELLIINKYIYYNCYYFVLWVLNIYIYLM